MLVFVCGLHVKCSDVMHAKPHDHVAVRCCASVPSAQPSAAQPGRLPGSWHTDPVAWPQPDLSPWEQMTWLRSPSYSRAAERKEKRKGGAQVD